MFSHFITDKQELVLYDCAKEAVSGLSRCYFSQIENLTSVGQKEALAYALEMPVYPLLSINYEGEFFCGALTRPDIFRSYYEEECSQFTGPFGVSKSDHPIPLVLIDETLASGLTQEQMIFRKISVLSIESVESINGQRVRPLHWFDPARIDYSINRLKHYTGVSAQHIQNHVIFVNYQKYLPYFLEFAMDAISKGLYEDLIGPGDISLVRNKMNMPNSWNDSINLPQMPAYNLTLPNREGITLINIGVGPSNAKTIADHLAVLRPKFALMLGHCGGLMKEQLIGDYVIGDAHLMIDFDNSFGNNNEFDLHNAMYCEDLAKCVGSGRKSYIGPVASFSDRNWELNASEIHKKLDHMGAIGVDMESAMLVKIFEQSGIPCASFLCVSDRPFHREIRLQQMAQNFYANKLEDHMSDALRMMQMVSLKKRVGKKDRVSLFR